MNQGYYAPNSNPPSHPKSRPSSVQSLGADGTYQLPNMQPRLSFPQPEEPVYYYAPGPPLAMPQQHPVQLQTPPPPPGYYYPPPPPMQSQSPYPVQQPVQYAQPPAMFPPNTAPPQVYYVQTGPAQQITTPPQHFGYPGPPQGAPLQGVPQNTPQQPQSQSGGRPLPPIPVETAQSPHVYRPSISPYPPQPQLVYEQPQTISTPLMMQPPQVMTPVLIAGHPNMVASMQAPSPVNAPSPAPKPQTQLAEARYEFEGGGEFLSFAKGDKIEILGRDKSDPNYYEGRNLSTGEEGTFPAKYVKLLQQ